MKQCFIYFISDTLHYIYTKIYHNLRTDDGISIIYTYSIMDVNNRYILFHFTYNVYAGTLYIRTHIYVLDNNMFEMK